MEIGQGTIFAHNVQVLSRNHNFDSKDLKFIPYDDRYINRKVMVGEYVWIGANALILPGVHLGDGSVIGAGAVVTKDVPAGAVVGGNPARILKYRDIDTFAMLRKSDKGYIKNNKSY